MKERLDVGEGERRPQKQICTLYEHLIYDKSDTGTIVCTYGETEKLSSYLTKINYR